MADAIEFSLTGLDELLGKLDEVSFDMKRKGGRFALRRAAQVIRDAAKQNAKRMDDPETAEDISANIAERWNGRLFKATGNLGFRVGVLGGAGGSKTSDQLSSLPGKDTRHWRYLEFGSENNRATPFMRPALEQSIGAATDTFVREYDKALDRAIKRARKKAAAGG
ncbi:HK97-gp10 family putative phage morphogenesis protein [Azotobacter chroococcum]|uniref:HK97 gp10 family phage protein n=1 Tax=Azotobacter chroococcum TaxID=353 RepID=A0AAP9YFQ6_9GAMM|nr:HK97-gp10 family putative phage morphogenesis protein [Azotobacter chroococcum]QQE90485.1 HK97 gp10 family phage protein [Azotobacter chroococcum]